MCFPGDGSLAFKLNKQHRVLAQYIKDEVHLGVLLYSDSSKPANRIAFT